MNQFWGIIHFRNGMVDAAFLAAMKDGALLAVALDVTDPEPLPPGRPLWSLPNAFITPHVAASTGYSALAAAGFLRGQVERYRSGVPLANVITGKYGARFQHILVPRTSFTVRIHATEGQPTLPPSVTTNA